MDETTKNRGKWGNSIEFLMSCIAMNVGLGNIWRFPFVAYENGGGAFLIPYISVLILLGRPMYYLEMCLGQFSSRGNVEMFESIAQVLKGVGFGQLIGTFSVATYYCSLMALTLYYLIHSFRPDLPWSQCDPNWGRDTWLGNNTCIPSKSTEVGVENSVSSAEAWFRIEVLREATDLSHGIGYPNWELTLCLLCSWIITFCICAKGVQSSGKAAYFLAIFPFIILFALLIRSVTLEGAGQGILYFVKPNWEKLLSAQVWYAAVTQCFFSLNIGFGSVTMYASYNSFDHNVYRDAMVVTTLDTFTSFLSGLIIFGILGNLAYKMNVEVSDVVKSGGTGLAFISYPEAIAHFDIVPWLFAILFFFMLFVLGVGSLIALKGCAFTVILDAFPHLKTWHVSFGTALVGFLVGLVYITPGGQFIFTMVDFFGGTFIFYVLTIIEVLSVMWWYGLENICLDIEFMSKKRPGPYWRICWAVIIPIVLITVFVYFIATLEELKYEDQSYPGYIIVWGWALFGVGVMQPLIWWGIEIGKNYKREGVSKAILRTFKHENWGPKEEEFYNNWVEFKRERRQKTATGRHWFKHKLCVLVGK
ncbi:Sodium-dependent nutrient amino acid transporter 1-like Protein [Tribolium castaneum]|uniref:Transporter n=1 Tax=Tribolium castaneum TaxID=7070 RepID=D6WWF2_TRICA|nr:PREDICTED: sodium-dependent nutrient amino acid transporter 1 [Tribolium castaneum]EFA08707.1 Sodium-dependent nutrient amino acid transporter 1-like Protein [Tribolium castaneum]|eukprot:XP_008196786.1 PREDICTED: sodium-dependent nutrient amino acid transporter 1 [Tribolium castaneum]